LLELWGDYGRHRNSISPPSQGANKTFRYCVAEETENDEQNSGKAFQVCDAVVAAPNDTTKVSDGRWPRSPDSEI